MPKPIQIGVDRIVEEEIKMESELKLAKKFEIQRMKDVFKRELKLLIESEIRD